MTHLILILCSLLGATRPATDRPTVIIAVGAEGAPEYAPEFARWADRWAAAAKRGGANAFVIGRDAPGNDGDRARLQSLLAAETSQSDHPLWLVLIGHGTYDGRDAKFNLRGPDVSAAELADWLKPIKRPLAVINCTSASAPFLNKLSAENRVVVTATRSGQETQFARFGDHVSTAITDPTADLDKDGQTSLLEAFIAASHRTEEFYKSQGRLETEHALLDDNADALGTPAAWFQGVRATKSARDGAPLDGPRAHQWHLVPSPADAALPPEVKSKRDALELKIESLRAKKSTIPEDAYYAQLESLLLDLARAYSDSPATRPAATTTTP